MNNPNLKYLSPHFSYEEAIISETASRKLIDNTPMQSTVLTLIAAAQKLEILRNELGTPLHINSWYRSPQLNSALGSATTSQHIRGEAIDFISPAWGTPTQIAKHIINLSDLIDYDQLILEHTWIHISFAILTGKPRKQVLSLLQGGHYANGLTDSLGNPI